MILSNPSIQTEWAKCIGSFLLLYNSQIRQTNQICHKVRWVYVIKIPHLGFYRKTFIFQKLATVPLLADWSMSLWKALGQKKRVKGHQTPRANPILKCHKCTCLPSDATSVGYNRRTGTASTGLSLSFPINVKPSRLTLFRAGIFWEPIMAQSTNSVTERLFTCSTTLCHWSLKRVGRGPNTRVCLPVSSAVKVNSRDWDCPLSLTASCSMPFTSCICQIFQFVLMVLPLMRSTATNANSSGRPKG